MRVIMRMCLWALLALLSACASTPQKEPEIARISPEELERIMPKPLPNLTLDEIVSLSKQGVAPETIIEKIKESKSTYALTPSQALDLSKQSVDAKVLDFIAAQREQLLRDSVADEINKREQANKKEQDRIKREYRNRAPLFYDPFIYPFWGWGYHPFYRNRFHFGYGF